MISRLLSFVLTALLWGASGIQIQAEESHPDLARLKSFRSYYHMDVVGQSGQHYEVWYSYKDEEGYVRWSTIRVSVANGADPEALSKQEYIHIPRFVAGWSKPPEVLKPIPAELSHQKDGIETAVRRNHSDLGVLEVRLSYLGEGILAAIYEVVPNTIAQNPFKRFGSTSTMYVFMNTQTRKIIEQTSIGSGVSFIRLGGLLAERSVTDPIWVDYVLPESIEGSSLLALGLRPEEPGLEKHRKELNKLLQVVLQTTQRIERGETIDPGLEKVLAKQSPSVLPKNFLQQLKFDLKIYGRVPRRESNEQPRLELYQGRMLFSLPVVDGPFSVEKTDAVSNVKLTLSGSFDSSQVHALSMILKMQDLKTGKSKTLKFRSQAPLEGYSPAMICERGVCAANGSFEFDIFRNGRRTEELVSVTFPGHSGYEQFDIYPSSSASAFPYTGVTAQ